MKTNDLVILALLILVAALVVDIWATGRADEQVKALAANSNTSGKNPLVITGFSGGVEVA